MVRVIPVLCGCYASFIPLLIMRYSAAVLLIPACHSPATPLLFPCYSLAIMALLWLYFFRCFLFIYLYAPPQKRRSSRRKSRGEAVVRSGRGRGRRSARRRQRARRQRHLAKRRPQAAGAPPLAAFENIAIAIGFLANKADVNVVGRWNNNTPLDDRRRRRVRARARHGGKLKHDFAGLAVELGLGHVGRVGAGSRRDSPRNSMEERCRSRRAGAAAASRSRS